MDFEKKEFYGIVAKAKNRCRSRSIRTVMLQIQNQI